MLRITMATTRLYGKIRNPIRHTIMLNRNDTRSYPGTRDFFIKNHEECIYITQEWDPINGRRGKFLFIPQNPGTFKVDVWFGQKKCHKESLLCQTYIVEVAE